MAAQDGFIQPMKITIAEHGTTTQDIPLFPSVCNPETQYRTPSPEVALY
jgi:hypothetical protein